MSHVGINVRERTCVSLPILCLGFGIHPQYSSPSSLSAFACLERWGVSGLMKAPYFSDAAAMYGGK